MNMLEATRQNAPEAVFVHMSTNKVYGDRPNTIPLVEHETRWDYADPAYANGITEDFPIDQSKHSLFGASKVAADVMVQEYGRYFGIRTCCLRGGCLTGPNHCGVELHGFLSYLIRCNVEGRAYKLFGYKGKQVRRQHPFLGRRAVHRRILRKSARRRGLQHRRRPLNSISVLEAFDRIASLTGKPMAYEYVETNRIGDHICYISDLSKMKAQYPMWSITKTLDDIFREIHDSWTVRLA